MKKMNLYSFIWFSLLLVNFAIAPVSAEDEEEVLSAQEFVDGCSEGYSPGKPNQYCMQYVYGLVQALAALQEMEPGNKIFCIDPTAIGLEEVTDNVTKWMESVPDRLHEDAYILASQALHESYPCSDNNI